ncbi:hypothetical protein [Motilimonas sp. E26]|uniref:hypothetical protein n=1 Tax=Motilimonas sp. E26 TaxID=2865674 RepID=UPI001E49457D|nr:hypothetical protein [Motilimonas sp. E26]MCE0559176.1 hypothetical protein [Motilimonas sp. E26]
MNRFKEQMLATEVVMWRKKGLFLLTVLICFFPFYITYITSQESLEYNLWQLRYFIAIAIIQAVAQITIAWYNLKNKVPNYLVLSFVVMMIFFQLTFGLTVILLTNA